MPTPARLPALLALAFSVAAPFARAQVAPSAPPAASDEPLVLSPFTVATERATGYQATSTLAGTRLNTAIKDVGAALSIYTKDFLTDVGATSAQDLLIYVTGAEVGGMNGNFAGTQQAANTSEGVRQNPQGATRIRGLAAANLTRGYFPTGAPFDDYNTSEITVSRGPNAILFGLGSPSGIINQGVLRADFRDRGSVAFRADNFGSTRSTLDLNRTLVPRKLAVRVAALYEDERFQQKPAFEQDRRAYLAATLTPFASTTVRASFEQIRLHANRPSSVLPIDSVSSWLANGKYAYDFAAFDRNAAVNAGLAPNIPTSAQGRTAPPGTTLFAYYDNPGVNTISRYLRSNIPGTQQQTVPGSFLNVDGQQENYNFYASTNLTNYVTGFRPQGFTPATGGVFGWKHRLFEGTTPFQNYRWRIFNVALEQRALRDHVGVELAYNWEDSASRTYIPFGNLVGSEVMIDINTTLSDGTANPNLGRPFLYTGAVNTSVNSARAEVLQATAFARYNFADLGRPWASWLGSHSLTGLAQRQRTPSLSYLTKIVIDSDSGIVERLIGASERPQPRQLNRVVYIGPSLLGAQSINDVKLAPINIPIWTPNQSYAARIYDPNTFGLVNTTVTSRAILNAGTLALDTVESYAAVLQSKWLKDHIVTLVGWRQDEAVRYANGTPPALNNANGSFTFDGWDLPPVPSQVAKGDRKTYSVVAKAPREIVRRLGFVSEVNAFYNQSGNFQAGAGRTDYLNRSLPPPTGVTKEYGFDLTLLRDKLSLRINQFETSAVSVSAGNGITNLANNYFNLIGNWETNRLNNPGGTYDPRCDPALLFRGIEPQIAIMKQYFSYAVTVNAQGVAGFSFRNPTALNDTTDFVAKGNEIDLVYNPTANWRILINGSKQRTIQSNIAPAQTSVLALVRPNLDAAANLPFSGLVGGGTVAAQMAGQVYTPYSQVVAQAGTQAYDQRKYRANLVTNYTFGKGDALRGWNVGGAYRWQDKAIVGYPLITVNGVSAPDFARKVTNPATHNLDFFCGYERKIWRGILWRAQLNVKNLIAPSEWLVLQIQPTGAPANYRLPGNRIFSLTNTFSF